MLPGIDRKMSACWILFLAACGRIGYTPAPGSDFILCGFIQPEEGAPGDTCGPLPFPQGPVICLNPDDDNSLSSTVWDAAEGTTIALAPGTYSLDEEALVFRRAGVTLRSASGLRDAIVGGAPNGLHVVSVRASDVTIANLRLSASIEATGAESTNTTGTMLHDLAILDPGEAAIVVKPNGGFYADQGTLSCSDILLTATGRLAITENTSAFTGRGLRDWTISSNRFEGWSSQEHTVRAIFLFDGGVGNIIEGNTLVDFGIGIGVGQGEVGADPRINENPPCAPGYFDDFGSIIRNNLLLATDVVRPADTGIGAWATCDTKILHNTLVFPDTAPLASIEYRFAVTSDLHIANNLSSHPLRERDGAVATLEENLLSVTNLSSVFRDVQSGDLHLLDSATNPARDRGVELALVPRDIDGQERDETPDLGADELP